MRDILNVFSVPLAVGLMTRTGLLAASGVALGPGLLGSAVPRAAAAGLPKIAGTPRS